jgi:hypothetical protein
MQDEPMIPSIVKRRKFLGSLLAGIAGGAGIRALIGKAFVRTTGVDRTASAITVEPHPSAVPRKRTRPHEA